MGEVAGGSLEVRLQEVARSGGEQRANAKTGECPSGYPSVFIRILRARSMRW